MQVEATALAVGAMAMTGTVLGAWLGVREANRLVNYRLDQLEKKLADQLELAQRAAVTEQELRRAFVLIEGLRHERETSVHYM